MTLVQTPNISQGILSNFHQHFIYQHSLHSSSDYVDLYCLLLSYIICIINISIMPYWHMHTIYIYIYFNGTCDKKNLAIMCSSYHCL